jgi:hypothetical protein
MADNIWRTGLWRGGRVVLSDADIDVMEARTWVQCPRRWTKRQLRALRSPMGDR